MKTIDNHSILRFVMVTALSMGLGFVRHASAQVQDHHSYLVDLKSKTAIDLGDVWATALNDTGQVVGGSHSTAHGFITGPNGVGMKDLGALSPSAVNNAGQVAGDYKPPESNRRSFITGPNGVGMKELGMLPGAGISTVIGINNAGQVVGNDCCAAGPMGAGTAFITGPDGVGITAIGGVSYAYDINDAGQVVGSMETGPYTFQPFITGPNGVGITFFDASVASAQSINNAGQVVGSLYTRGSFITGPNGVGMTDLGELPIVNDINDAGQVVGTSGNHAFITGPNGAGLTYLNSLVHLPDGLVMDSAIAINNMGQVLVSAGIPVIPAVPEPESYALMLAGLALTGVIVRRKQKSDAEGRPVSL